MAQIKKWLVQQLRVSIFPIPETFDSSKSILPPDKNITIDKQTIDSKTGVNVYEGWFNNNRLNISVAPVKIDLILEVATLAHLDKDGAIIDSLGEFAEGLNVFEKVVKPWIESENLPEIKRIAFGAQLVMKTSTRNDAYKTLSSYTPVDLKPDKMSDFQLQLNIFTDSKIIKGLKLNRLTKWNAIKVTPELGLLNNAKTIHQYPLINLAHVELDLSTSADNELKLDKKSILSLYKELVEHGKALSEKGVR